MIKLVFVLGVLVAGIAATDPVDVEESIKSVRVPKNARIILSEDGDFSCAGRLFGLYPDLRSQCKVVHICHPSLQLPPFLRGGPLLSFYCAGDTAFDSKTQSCSKIDVGFPCLSSPSLYEFNHRLTQLITKVSDPIKDVFEPLNPFRKPTPAPFQLVTRRISTTTTSRPSISYPNRPMSLMELFNMKYNRKTNSEAKSKFQAELESIKRVGEEVIDEQEDTVDNEIDPENIMTETPEYRSPVDLDGVTARIDEAETEEPTVEESLEEIETQADEEPMDASTDLPAPEESQSGGESRSVGVEEILTMTTETSIEEEFLEDETQTPEKDLIMTTEMSVEEELSEEDGTQLTEDDN